MKQMVREHKILDEFGSRLNLNSEDKFELDGNELGGGEVKASDVNSETATQGKVLTANGNGGASWETIESGNKTYIHTISFRGTIDGLGNPTYVGQFELLTPTSEQFNSQTLLTYLQQHHPNFRYAFVPTANISYNNDNYIVWGFFGASPLQVRVMKTSDFEFINYVINLSANNFYDTVKEL